MVVKDRLLNEHDDTELMAAAGARTKVDVNENHYFSRLWNGCWQGFKSLIPRGVDMPADEYPRSRIADRLLTCIIHSPSP